MRQPKFRGFSKETNSWHYGHGWFKSDYTEEYKQEKGIEDTTILHTDYSPVECELSSMGQFTGVHDKNGTEIYEGDIIRSYNEYDEPFEVLSVVEYDEQYAKYRGVDIECLDYEEVIGNIYENPSLLEDKQ
ncbi:YopX family protein [Bacillus infantis]|uniref:YopX family protein n=1 Tax=Bacillus infantis TaxID=324767 RepID=UPI003CF210CD